MKLSLAEISELEQMEAGAIRRLEERKRLRAENIVSLEKIRALRTDAEREHADLVLDHHVKRSRELIDGFQVTEDRLIDLLAELERGKKRDERTLSLIRTTLETEFSN